MKEKKNQIAQLSGRLLGHFEMNANFDESSVRLLEDLLSLSQSLDFSIESGAIETAIQLIRNKTKLSPEEAAALRKHLLTLKHIFQPRFQKIVNTSLTTLGAIGALLTILLSLGLLPPSMLKLGPTESHGKFELSDKSTWKGSPFGNSKSKLKEEHGLFWVYLAQLSIIALILMNIWMRVRKFEKFQETNFDYKAIHQFSRYYSLLWVSWFFLYLLFAIDHQVEAGRFGTNMEHTGRAYGLLIEFLNNATSYCFFICFAVLDQPSVEYVRGDQRDHRFRTFKNYAFLIFFICTAFSGLTILQSGWMPEDWRNASRLPSALFAGVAICFFLGRLDSKFFNINRFLIGLLYGYAVIQLSWPIIRGTEFLPEEVRGSILLASLVGKILLWRAVDTLFARDLDRFRRYISWMKDRVDI